MFLKPLLLLVLPVVFLQSTKDPGNQSHGSHIECGRMALSIIQRKYIVMDGKHSSSFDIPNTNSSFSPLHSTQYFGLARRTAHLHHDRGARKRGACIMQFSEPRFLNDNRTLYTDQARRPCGCR
jgi:hypothetical protein